MRAIFFYSGLICALPNDTLAVHGTFFGVALGIIGLPTYNLPFFTLLSFISYLQSAFGCIYSPLSGFLRLISSFLFYLLFFLVIFEFIQSRCLLGGFVTLFILNPGHRVLLLSYEAPEGGMGVET